MVETPRILSDDVRDLLRLFAAHSVEYVLVGGYAVNYYGFVRATQDIDLLVRPSKENARRAMRALSDFGFGAAGIPQELLERPGTAIHLGAEPNRIDILTTLKGVDVDTVFASAREVELHGTRVPIIALEHLVQSKRSSERPRDLADAAELIRITSQDEET